MNLESIDSLINKGIANLASSFETNELAYLALTSKPELALRDRLAFALHRELSRGGILVAREWKGGMGARIDLALLEGGKPVALLEFKAMYTFDGTPHVRPTPTVYPEVVTDLEKMKRIANKEARLYLTLFATHPLRGLDHGLAGVAKYHKDVNRAFDHYVTAERILETCKVRITEFFRQNSLHISHYGEIPAGESFGVGVRIPFWMLGPSVSPDQ